MSFALYRYVWPKSGRGEYWHGETHEENLALTEYETILPTVVKVLPEQGMILDVGCGIGRWLVYLRRLGYPAIGVDISAEALQTIRSLGESVPILQGDAERVPLASGAFEAVTSFGVFEHFEAGPEKSLQEASRVLKTGGLLLLTVPYQNLIRQLLYRPLLWLAGKMLKRMGFQPEFSEYRFSKGDAIQFVREAGFQLLLVEPVDFVLPKSLGLYVDWRQIMGSSHRRWELNAFGKMLQRCLGLFSKWVYCEGILLVARKQ